MIVRAREMSKNGFKFYILRHESLQIRNYAGDGVTSQPINSLPYKTYATFLSRSILNRFAANCMVK